MLAAIVATGCGSSPGGAEADAGANLVVDAAALPDAAVDDTWPMLPPLSTYTDFIDPANHYEFPFDDDGWAIVTAGAEHKVIYASSSAGDDANDGLTEATPVATLAEAASRLAAGSSDWILLRRGDTFAGTRLPAKFAGPSAAHPMLIGAYGAGPRPVVTSALMMWDGHDHVVLRDLHLRRVGKFCLDVLGPGQDLYLENVVTEGCESRIQAELADPRLGVTLRRVMLLDAHQDQAGAWNAFDDRISGIYVQGVDGLLIEESFADHNGWQDGYSEVQAAGPQPPSMFSHNFYLQSSNANVVFRDNVTARGASYGAQVRPGGVVAGNVFLANNAACYTSGDRGSLVAGNVVSIAGNKRAEQIGAIGWGLSTYDVAGTVVRGNLVAHSLDPLDASPPDDGANDALARTTGATLEGNVIYGWGSDDDAGADFAALPAKDSTSAMAYAGQHAGASTLTALLQAFRERDRGAWPREFTARALRRYFFAGFAMSDAATPNP